MSKARPVIIAFVVYEDLGLVFEPPEGGGVDDPVVIALVAGAVLMLLFFMRSSLCHLACLGVQG